MHSSFVHLRLHTEYSMRDGLLRIPELIARVKSMGMTAVAISDHSNLCGMVKFYKEAIAQGIKPIIAADVLIRDEQEQFLATLYCQNEIGYRNLTWLLSESYLIGQKEEGDPLLHWDWLAQHTEGLIALSGGCFGNIGQALLSKKIALAKMRLDQWRLLFPNRFYLELTRTGRSQEASYLKAALEFSIAHEVPVLATNDVRFLERDDFEAHEARVCIYQSRVLEDSTRPRHYSEEQYVKSPEEMTHLFRDIPEALENAVELAKRCTCVISLGAVFLPKFPVPSQFTANSYLEDLSFKGLHKYLEKSAQLLSQREQYEARLRLELSVIIQMGFSGYFLIVSDFIRWAKENKIPVGPGRGSGAGSLVAFSLNITALDPLEHELLFERFLNPERISLPDFDVDFCMEGRDRVIGYVAQCYGRDAVSQIITYGTMAARAVVRDVGRVLGLPYGFCDKLAKLIPFEVGMTLDKALLQEELLARRYRDEADVTTLINLARKLEGITRNAGKHAGGLVIAPGRLTDFTPLYCEKDGTNLVTQFDKDDVEAIGLVKFDFLGLRTLTIIDWALQTINQRRQQEQLPVLDVESIKIGDPLVFQLLQRGETTAIFQLESRGMKELMKRLKPDSFDDIIALVALFRPGPLQSGMVDDYIDRKQGRAPVHYPHPEILGILKPTYGVILYQEQVMQIAQVLAGYTLGGADLLRRAMGKKNADEMARQRSIFVTGASNRGIDPNLAESIFDLMEKFSGYGFNKSHSAAYAVLTYQTAWLKVHYPAEFMAAVLSSDMDNTDKVIGFITECEAMGLCVIPPDINRSNYQFSVNSERNIIYGLGAVKGVGASAAAHMVAERAERGPYVHLYEFCQRLDLHKVSRRVLEALIKCGAFDCFQVDRATLFASIDCAIQGAEQKEKTELAGQVDLFGDVSFDTAQHHHVDYLFASPWPEQMQLQFEKETLGYYISGHPFRLYQMELAKVVTCPFNELAQYRHREGIVAGFLVSHRVIVTKSGRRMAVLKLEDQTGVLEVTVFSKLFESVNELLHDEHVLVVKGKFEEDTFVEGMRVIAEQVWTLDEYRKTHVRKLVLCIKTESQLELLLEELSKVIEPYRGGTCPMIISYKTADAQAELVLGKEWEVTLTDKLLVDLRQICGPEQVCVIY